MVTLPCYTFRGRSHDAPHVADTLLECVWPNQYGTVVKYVIKVARNKKTWWVHASYPGTGKWGHSDYTSSMRASLTLRTISPKTAQRWIEAVESGNIEVSDSY